MSNQLDSKPNDPHFRFHKRLENECLPYIERHTVPFYFVDEEYVGELEVKRDRTGVLYRIGDHYFIVTAAHKLQKLVELNRLLYIGHSAATALPIPLAEATFHSTEVEYRDVAAIKLPTDVVDELSKSKSFLSHYEVRLKDDRSDSLYVVFGYPGEWLRAGNGSVNSMALGVVTHRQIGNRSESDFYDPNLNVVLALDDRAYGFPDRMIHRLPNLHGISGCGIWRVASVSQNLETWSMTDVALVGIQNRWVPGRAYVQGTWLDFALGLVKDMYPSASTAMSLIYPRG